MYVCLCNGITDRAFQTQVDCGDRTVSMVYRSLGKKPQCGKCVAFVHELLRLRAKTQDHSLIAAAAG